MAVSATVSGVGNIGGLKIVYGTFTSAEGDSSGSFAATLHGLNNIWLAHVTLDTGGIAAQQPKVTVSSGTVTATWDDTLGYSGKFVVIGR